MVIFSVTSVSVQTMQNIVRRRSFVLISRFKVINLNMHLLFFPLKVGKYWFVNENAQVNFILIIITTFATVIITIVMGRGSPTMQTNSRI